MRTLRGVAGVWVLGFAMAAVGQMAAPVVHAAYPRGEGTALGAQIAGLLSDPGVSRAHWGIAVTALDGTPVYGLEEGKLFRPASTAKLFTTAAAMALLKSEMTFETRVYGMLRAETGEVSGDLVLLGGGDPSFGSGDLPFVLPAERGKKPKRAPRLDDLEELADQIVAKGVKRISGDVIGDDSLFPWEPYGESWAADDVVWGYGAPVSALTVADNQLRLTVTPGVLGKASGVPATVQLEQFGVPYYTIKAEVETRAAKAGPQGIQVERDAATRTLRVYGQLAEGAPVDVEWVAIDDPAAFAAMALRGMLVQRGIAVEGGARSKHRMNRSGMGFMAAMKLPGRCEKLTVEGGECGGSCVTASQTGAVLATHTSAPMAEDVLYTLKESENLHAEILLHHLGRRVFCGQGSTAAGERMVHAFLEHAHVDPADLMFFDGSGLSAKDVVTPRAAVELLHYAVGQPWYAAWKASLPVGGVDGTLSERFKEAPLKGHVFAKTGTLGESRALAGYLDCVSGKQVIFSILVDNHEPGSRADRVVMDKIVAAIAAAE